MITSVMESTTLKQDILRHLKRGKHNAIKKADLARLCNCDEREMRRIITEELVAQDKQLIGLSTGKPAGYFIIETPEELEHCMNTLQGYCVNAAIHRRNLKRAARTRLFGQVSMRF